MKHTLRLTRLWRLTLEPERRKNWKAVTRNESSKGRSLTRRSSCLLFQMFCVETNSFLPNEQSDRGNLARQRETCHVRLQSEQISARGHSKTSELDKLELFKLHAALRHCRRRKEHPLKLDHALETETPSMTGFCTCVCFLVQKPKETGLRHIPLYWKCFFRTCFVLPETP